MHALVVAGLPHFCYVHKKEIVKARVEKSLGVGNALASCAHNTYIVYTCVCPNPLHVHKIKALSVDEGGS